MPVKMIVCVKQVVDPETPASAFQIDAEMKRIVPALGIPPVINGFDENAVEAALRLKDALGGTITVLSVGDQFVMDVMKKPLSMGCDELVLVQDPVLVDLDPYATAYVLSKAVDKLGEFDLLLCGRQASDWDNATVPLGLAELLGLPCVTLVQKMEIVDSRVAIQRFMSDGYEAVEADLPALVTVTNELGIPRYPTLRGIMNATRMSPTVWTAADISLESSELAPKVRLVDLSMPTSQRQCEFIEADSEADAGRQLAVRLREEKLI